MNLENIDFIVINQRTGNEIAAFLLPSDALKYIAYRRQKEGPNGPSYNIVNKDETPVSMALENQIKIANRSTLSIRLARIKNETNHLTTEF